MSGKVSPVWNEDLTLSITIPDLPIKIQVYEEDYLYDNEIGDAEFSITLFLEAANMRLEGHPSGTIVARIQPSRQNCLADESQIIWVDGKLIQNLSLRLRNVRHGEVELQLRWIDIPGSRGVSLSDYIIPAEVREAGFGICADELGTIVQGHDMKRLILHGGIDGIANKISTSTANGLSTDNDLLNHRREVYGINECAKSETWSFWIFVWEAYHDMTLITLGVCALVFLIVGIAREGWSKGARDGFGIFASIWLVVYVTATSDYFQSLLFSDWYKEKKKNTIQVTRNGFRQKLSIYDLLAGDIVHLTVGDQVPADGLFVSGFSVLIDESSITSESKLAMVNSENPYMRSGTKIQHGSCKMMVTAVGLRTLWGKRNATLSEGYDETPLQVKLNGVATIISKIGLAFVAVTFEALVQGLFCHKWHEGSHLSWSATEAVKMLEYFTAAVAIAVVAILEGLPVALTSSLAFAMKKMVNDKALVQHLAACETMGSATTICSGKTGMLTTSHMTVVKSCICINIRELGQPDKTSSLCAKIPDSIVKLLLESIFNNTAGEIEFSEDGKLEILGTPIERALLEFGLSLDGDFQAVRKAVKLVNVEPFNSTKMRMAVMVKLPEGGLRAHTKGASEIVLAACDKVIDPNGQIVPLDGTLLNHLNDTIHYFASEALTTLCLAYRDLEGGFSSYNSIPASGYTCIGILGIKDPVRPGVKEAVAACRSAGITIRMVSGDNIITAKAVAKECGILTDDGIAIEGTDFREMKQEEMLELIPKLQVMARCSPMDNHALVEKLQTTFGEVVAVTGDTTNDAPALHKADIGLAMGIAGTEVAKESADIIILDEGFSTIIQVVKWGRSIYINFQKFVQFHLTVYVVTLIINFSSACFTGTVPFTVVQLLWINIIMDILGPLALTTEPPNDELMKRAPIGKQGKFISNVMQRNILGQSLYQFIVIYLLQEKWRDIFDIGGPDSDLVLNTFIFNSFVFCQVFNVISSREMEKINVFKGIHNMFLVVLGCTVLFQIIIVEFLGAFANTEPLTLSQWLGSVIIGFLGMPMAAILKMINCVLEMEFFESHFWTGIYHRENRIVIAQ
ncbi:hypothetical protein JCGZ_13435 [Jatropha curcas]|uniref:Calcium-transporting ATPase n=3 Tax=Jatropha curcas TaxID=180498 RepID=A0A067KLN7_JATCU|nr:hypothetical protein JCGZ_13435 [Jatropha curcas]